MQKVGVCTLLTCQLSIGLHAPHPCMHTVCASCTPLGFILEGLGKLEEEEDEEKAVVRPNK